MKLKEIRQELKTMVPGSLCDDVWSQWREVAQIQKNARTCTSGQWKFLFACAVLYREGKRGSAISRDAVRDRLKAANYSLTELMPGYRPLRRIYELPRQAIGRELPEILEDQTGERLSEDTIARYCRALHFADIRAQSKGLFSSIAEVEQALRIMRVLNPQKADAETRLKMKAIEKAQERSFGLFAVDRVFVSSEIQRLVDHLIDLRGNQFRARQQNGLRNFAKRRKAKGQVEIAC